MKKLVKVLSQRTTITIIVLLILAVVAINAVQNDGIIEYAKNARYDYENAQKQEQSYLDYYTSQIQSSTGKGTAHGGIIPEDGKYKKAGENTFLEEGEYFPAEPQDGDIYRYGDYEYCYNNWYKFSESKWVENKTINGWGVRVVDTGKTKYEEILTTINNKDIVAMHNTFNGCTSLQIAPKLPDTVKWMRFSFSECSALTQIQNIPSSTIDMSAAFYNCTSLISVPKIPDNVTNMTNTFQECIALKEISNIPKNVDDLYCTFQGCTSLTGKILIETTSLTNYVNCFYGTTKLITLIGVGETTGADGKKAYENDGVLNNLITTAKNGNVEILR